MTILFAAFASTSGHPTLGLLIGFAIGALLFFLGFRRYREYRILADTPEMPVRSIPMGLVHVHGKATGDDRLASPLTRMPCFYYRVQLEKWVKKDKGSEWENVGTEKDERPFYLDDGTGKVLVNPQHAEYDVVRTFRGEIGPNSSRTRSVDPSLGVAGPSDQDLRAYVTGGFSRARAAFEATNLPGAKAIGKVLAVEQKLESMGVSLSGGGLSMDLGGHTYRFTEHALLADRECNVLGTCTENPSPKDQHDRNLLKKGENEKTFVISSKTEKQLEKSLRLQALVMILIGAAIMIGVVAIALHNAKML
jgi:hypothetical protein